MALVKCVGDVRRADFGKKLAFISYNFSKVNSSNSNFGFG